MRSVPHHASLTGRHCNDREQAELERVVGTNVFGAFATIKAFYPLLKVRQSGRAACICFSPQMGRQPDFSRREVAE